MNALEKMIVNSKIRGVIQRYYEFPLLKKFAPLPPSSRALEMGCGCGRGIEILYTYMGADQVDAFDLDPDMVTRTRERLDFNGMYVPLWQGSAADIPATTNTYDGVFCFGILHHMPEWRLGIREAHRVLKSGGHFYISEYYKSLITNPVVNTLLTHPQKNRFDHTQLRSELRNAGFKISGEKNMANMMGYIVAQKL